MKKDSTAKKLNANSEKLFFVSDIIRKLIRECGNIREAELAQQTYIPQRIYFNL